MVNNTLAGCLDIYAIIYLDDILIYSENLEDYQKHIKDVLERFLVKQLRYKLKKYKFYKKEINFLGFIIRINKIKINSEKIQKVLD